MARRSYRRKRRSSNDAGIVLVMVLFVVAKFSHIIRIPLPIVILAVVVLVGYCAVIIVPKLRNKRRYGKASLNDLDQMKGEDFEQALLYYFKRMGWKLEDTRKTGDFGADLIGIDPSGQRCVIQSKRWESKVGVDGVNQVIAAREYYKATRALVVTNNWLTRNARELAKETNVETWERNKLQWLLKQATSQVKK